MPTAEATLLPSCTVPGPPHVHHLKANPSQVLEVLLGLFSAHSAGPVWVLSITIPHLCYGKSRGKITKQVFSATQLHACPDSSRASENQEFGCTGIDLVFFVADEHSGSCLSLCPVRTAAPGVILQDVRGGGHTTLFLSPPGPCPLSHGQHRALQSPATAADVQVRLLPWEHLHHRGSFCHFPAKLASALGFSILPEESGWQRWHCSDKCIALPARGTWSSASETAQNLQGPKSPCPITKKPSSK